MPSIRDNLHENLQGADDEPEKPSSERNFGLVFAGFFGILAVLAWHAGRPTAPWLCGIAVAFAAIALAMATVAMEESAAPPPMLVMASRRRAAIR